MGPKARSKFKKQSEVAPNVQSVTLLQMNTVKLLFKNCIGPNFQVKRVAAISILIVMVV